MEKGIESLDASTSEELGTWIGYEGFIWVSTAERNIDIFYLRFPTRDNLKSRLAGRGKEESCVAGRGGQCPPAGSARTSLLAGPSF